METKLLFCHQEPCRRFGVAKTAKPVKEDVDLGALPRRRGLGPADQQSLQPSPHSFVPFADILAKTETSESQFSGGPMGMLLGYGAITII